MSREPLVCSPLHPYPIPCLEVIRLTTLDSLVPPSLEHLKRMLLKAIKPWTHMHALNHHLVATPSTLSVHHSILTPCLGLKLPLAMLHASVTHHHAMLHARVTHHHVACKRNR